MDYSDNHHFANHRHGDWQHNGRHFPPFAFFGGLFVLFVIIKTGLFVPLLLIGGFMCLAGMAHKHGMTHGFHPMHEGHGQHEWARRWHEHHMQEKRKHDDSGYI